jgi:hypothetical protein
MVATRGSAHGPDYRLEISMPLRSVPPRGGHVATAFGADQSSKGLG